MRLVLVVLLVALGCKDKGPPIVAEAKVFDGRVRITVSCNKFHIVSFQGEKVSCKTGSGTVFSAALSSFPPGVTTLDLVATDIDDKEVKVPITFTVPEGAAAVTFDSCERGKSVEFQGPGGLTPCDQYGAKLRLSVSAPRDTPFELGGTAYQGKASPIEVTLDLASVFLDRPLADVAAVRDRPTSALAVAWPWKIGSKTGRLEAKLPDPQLTFSRWIAAATAPGSTWSAKPETGTAVLVSPGHFVLAKDNAAKVRDIAWVAVVPDSPMSVRRDRCAYQSISDRSAEPRKVSVELGTYAIVVTELATRRTLTFNAEATSCPLVVDGDPTAVKGEFDTPALAARVFEISASDPRWIPAPP